MILQSAIITEACSEHFQTCGMEPFVKLSLNAPQIYTRITNLDAASVLIAQI